MRVDNLIGMMVVVAVMGAGGSSQAQTEPKFGRVFTNSVGMELVGIEPGSFMMGSPESELGRDSDEIEHRVTLTKGYWIGKFEVRQNEFAKVMHGINPSCHKKVGGDAPVENVSWKDAVFFCQELTLHDFRAGKIPKGYWYRLPTEAQWEYACRAGTTSALYSGKELSSLETGKCSNLDELAWYQGNSRDQTHLLGQTHPVGQKKPNAWGLYDMLGNVKEWCMDGYHRHPKWPPKDPIGPQDVESRVCRGGSYHCFDRNNDCRSGARTAHAVVIRTARTVFPFKSDNIGFRVALVPSPE
ncbi:MAG: formylglycine-generating enzyme family protein [Verrucomicrobia bacterium]|nr:formylglycine-generating enzyme family protein [Verrucomicrobiota bacterium]